MNSIPKIIHQIWIGDESKIPASCLVFRDHMLNLHPDWEYKLWTRENIPELVNQEVFDALQSHVVFQSDIARYEIMAHHGGVYIDWDMCLSKPIDELIEGTDHFFIEENGLNITNSIYGVCQNHWFSWKAVRGSQQSFKRYLNSELFYYPYKNYLVSVGALFFSNLVLDAAKRVPLNILPWQLFNPFKPVEFRRVNPDPDIPSYSFGMHTYNSVVDQTMIGTHRRLPEYETYRSLDEKQRAEGI